MLTPPCARSGRAVQECSFPRKADSRFSFKAAVSSRRRGALLDRGGDGLVELHPVRPHYRHSLRATTALHGKRWFDWPSPFLRGVLTNGGISATLPITNRLRQDQPGLPDAPRIGPRLCIGRASCWERRRLARRGEQASRSSQTGRCCPSGGQDCSSPCPGLPGRCRACS
jgi:hypothetical protein